VRARAVISFRIAFEVLSIGVDTRLFVPASRAVHVGCFCFRVIVKLLLLLLISSLFVNKDLCTRKSVKRTIKEVRDKRLASAWRLKMSGSFSQELEQ